MKKVNVMIDFEGCGDTPLALGALEFDVDGVVYDQFYSVIDGRSAEKLGLLPNIDTFYWWMRQPKEAQEALLKNRKPLVKVMNDFVDWLKGLSDVVFEEDRFRNVELWAFGGSYDFPMLERCIKLTMPKRKFPLSFRCFNDARTVLRLEGVELHKLTRDGVYHNALDDCLFQIKHLTKNVNVYDGQSWTGTDLVDAEADQLSNHGGTGK